MRVLGDFRRKVRQLIKTCPTAIIDEAIRDAAIEFADYTYCWHEELPRIRAREGVEDYEFTAPCQGRISKILYLSHSGTQVLPTTEATLDTFEDGWRDAEAQVATWYYLPDREHIRLALKPSATESRAIRVWAAFKPIQDATQLADVFYEDHFESISHGALMRLYGNESEVWGSAGAADIRRVMFDKAKRKERAEQLNNHTRESKLTIRAHSYW